jgi:hypothetical protein
MLDVRKHFKPVSILVDVGCGIVPTTMIKSDVHICIEPWKEYMDILMICHPDDAKYVFIQDDAIGAIRKFPDNSVDTVYMADLIEHLDKEAGIKLLREADRIAKNKLSCSLLMVLCQIIMKIKTAGD